MEDYLFALNHFYGIEILTFLLMPNHFHMIALQSQGNLSEGMQFFMKETSRWITKEAGRINQCYGGRFHRSLISYDHYYLLAYKYVYRNPVAAGLCRKVEEYPYSTLSGLLGLRRLIIPVAEDETLNSDVEGTVHWLNQSPKPEHIKAVKSALRRSEFKLPLDPRTKKKNELELALL